MQKAVLITGCSTGIGLASARVMKARGWRVLATARKSADLERLAGEDGFETIELELGDAASVQRCARVALELTEGRLLGLFNNAAYGQVGAMEDVTADLLRQQLEVNVVGTHELTRLILPAMRANGGGRIVQCSSVLGMMAAPYRGAYCASKFALEALTDALRLELRGSGVHVSLIEPGPIATAFVATALRRFRETINIDASAHRATYLARLAAMEAGGATRFKLPPEAVAQRLVHALESPRPQARYFVTTPTYIAAVARRLLPTSLLDRLAVGA